MSSDGTSAGVLSVNRRATFDPIGTKYADRRADPTPNYILGIVTEVAIFYFSEFDDLRENGMPFRRALVDAGRNRFRPIAMTTVAAIFN